MRTQIAAFLALIMLSACGGSESLSTLRTAAPASDPYLAALVDGYQQFGDQKAAMSEWDMANYFAEKGLRASAGEEVEPEDLANWQIPPVAATSLASSRENLITAIDANKSTQPALTAAAVVAYDRWVEAVANNPSADQIDARAVAFQSALEKLGQVQAAQPGTNAPLSEPGVKANSKAATILYFPFDKDSLGSTAKAALNKVTHQIKGAPAANVTINGHADRAGTEAYNLDLSQRRAKFVEKALKANGVPQKQLHYFAFGESDPAVPTEDGVEEPKNRRVEIFIE